LGENLKDFEKTKKKIWFLKSF